TRRTPARAIARAASSAVSTDDVRMTATRRSSEKMRMRSLRSAWGRADTDMCRWYRGLSSRGGDRAFEHGDLLLGLERALADRLHEHLRGFPGRKILREFARHGQLADDVAAP